MSLDLLSSEKISSAVKINNALGHFELLVCLRLVQTHSTMQASPP